MVPPRTARSRDQVVVPAPRPLMNGKAASEKTAATTTPETTPPFAVGSLRRVQSRSGETLVAEIVAVTDDRCYVHYVAHDRRLDEWVDKAKLAREDDDSEDDDDDASTRSSSDAARSASRDDVVVVSRRRAAPEKPSLGGHETATSSLGKRARSGRTSPPPRQKRFCPGGSSTDSSSGSSSSRPPPQELLLRANDDDDDDDDDGPARGLSPRGGGGLATRTRSTEAAAAAAAAAAEKGVSALTAKAAAPDDQEAEDDDDDDEEPVEETASSEQQHEPPAHLSEREKRLFRLRLQMNRSRVANAAAVRGDKKRKQLLRDDKARQRAEATEEWRQELAAQGLSKAQAHLVQPADATLKRETALRKKEKRKAAFGWDVFNADALHKAYEKRLDDLPGRDETAGADDDDDDGGPEFGDARPPSEAALARMTAELEKRDKKQAAFSRRRATVPGEDIDFINERNRHYNKKLKRAFDPYTVEIKQNLERGTAI